MIMAGLSFLSMYILMYAMVNTIADVFNNFNQVYMVGLMTALMILIELLVMRTIYPDQRRNAFTIAVSVIALLGSFFLIRQQAEIDQVEGILRTFNKFPSYKR